MKRHGGNRPPVDPLVRLMRRVDKDAPGGCWIFTGPTCRKGYGRISVEPGKGERGVAVHRLSYERMVGPIPEGHVVHHVCRVKRCVNPDHLVALTQQDHDRVHGRGIDLCQKCGGNDWRMKSTGYRECRACDHRRNAEARARRALRQSESAAA